jgi:hypothetical protein
MKAELSRERRCYTADFEHGRRDHELRHTDKQPLNTRKDQKMDSSLASPEVL